MIKGISAHSLASGSSGNSFLIRTPKVSVLIDAGISCRRLQAALLSLGQNPADLAGILITHEHSDHTQGAILFSRKFRVPLISNSLTLSAIVSGMRPHTVLEPGEGLTLDDLRIEAFSIPHDAVNPVGYSLHSGRHKILCATDVGHLTDTLRQESREADLLIVESNHDINRLLNGPYPQVLKRRIMSDRGHLSNDATGDLLVERAAHRKAATAWLAHLSKTNNSPSLALSSARARLIAAGTDTLAVQVALRDHPSVSWQAENRAFQISLAI